MSIKWVEVTRGLLVLLRFVHAPWRIGFVKAHRCPRATHPKRYLIIDDDQLPIRRVRYSGTV